VVNGNAEVTGFVATLGETLLERATITLLEKFFNSLKYNTKTYDK
jgi:carbon monoxide dehydrogenase subunit G